MRSSSGRSCDEDGRDEEVVLLLHVLFRLWLPYCGHVLWKLGKI